MEEQDYREAVKKLMNSSLTFDEKLGNFALGLVCETGELAEKLGSTERKVKLDEFSDCRWYFTASAIMLNFDTYYKTIDKMLLDQTFTTHNGNIQELFIRACKFGDLVKKVIYHKHSLLDNKVMLISSLLKYYITYRQMLLIHGFTDAEVKQYNIDKLSARYDGLTFTVEKSVNRKNELV